MLYDEFVERTDWLSDEELLDIVKIFREKANKFPQEITNKRIGKISRATCKILSLFRRVRQNFLSLSMRELYRKNEDILARIF